MESDISDLTSLLERVAVAARQDAAWLARGSSTFAWLEQLSLDGSFGRFITAMENHSAVDARFCASSAVVTFIHILRGILEGTHDSNVKLRVQTYMCRAAVSLADSLEIARKQEVTHKLLTCLTRGGALGWTGKGDSKGNVDPKVAAALIDRPDVALLLDLLSSFSCGSDDELQKDIAVSSVHFVKLLAVASGHPDFLFIRIGAFIQQMQLSLVLPTDDHTLNPDEDPGFVQNINHLLPTLLFGLIVFGPARDDEIQQIFWSSNVPRLISNLLESRWVAHREKSTLLSIIHSLAGVSRLSARLKGSGLIESVIKMMSTLQDQQHRIDYALPFSELLFRLAKHKAHRKALQATTFDLLERAILDHATSNKAVLMTALFSTALIFSSSDRGVKLMLDSMLPEQLVRLLEEAAAASDCKATVVYEPKWRLSVSYHLEDLLLVSSALSASPNQDAATRLADAGIISLLSALLTQAKSPSSSLACVACLRPMALICLNLSRVDNLIVHLIGAGQDELLEEHAEHDDVGISLASREARSNMMQRRAPLAIRINVQEDRVSAGSPGRSSDPGPPGRSSLPPISASSTLGTSVNSTIAAGFSKGIMHRSQSQSLSSIREGTRRSFRPSSIQQQPWQSVTKTDMRLISRFSSSGASGSGLSKGIQQLPPI